MKKTLFFLLIALIALTSCAQEAAPAQPQEYVSPPEPAAPVIQEEPKPAAQPVQEQPVVEAKPAAEVKPTTVDVTIQNFAFNPATITISAGSTVRFTNKDGVTHTATGDRFDAGAMRSGESKEVTFDQPGTYEYHCNPHPSMKGKIIVQ